MPVIEIRAREYASAAEMRAHYAAIDSSFRPAPPRVEFGTDLRPSAPPVLLTAPDPRERLFTDLRSRRQMPPLLITDDVYAAWLRGLMAPATLRANGADVCRIVGGRFGLSFAELRSKSRIRFRVVPRQIAMYICVRSLGLSTTLTGQILGMRDHTTVIHGVRQTSSRMARDQHFAAEVAALIGACGIA